MRCQPRFFPQKNQILRNPSLFVCGERKSGGKESEKKKSQGLPLTPARNGRPAGGGWVARKETVEVSGKEVFLTSPINVGND